MQEAHVWNPRLDLEHGELDSEHHLQIAMIGALVEAIEQRRPVMAKRLAEQLEKYSAAHFVGEELVMESSDYPRRAAHHEEHEGILKRIAGLKQLLDTGDYDEAHTTALDLLTGLGAHISGSDGAFAQHVKERRSARARPA